MGEIKPTVVLCPYFSYCCLAVTSIFFRFVFDIVVFSGPISGLYRSLSFDLGCLRWYHSLAFIYSLRGFGWRLRSYTILAMPTGAADSVAVSVLEQYYTTISIVVYLSLQVLFVVCLFV